MADAVVWMEPCHVRYLACPRRFTALEVSLLTALLVKAAINVDPEDIAHAEVTEDHDHCPSVSFRWAALAQAPVGAIAELDGVEPDGVPFRLVLAKAAAGHFYLEAFRGDTGAFIAPPDPAALR